MPQPASHLWLHRFALLTAAATFVLISIGGLVTSHGAGMAVPDWPNSYGYNMFTFPVSMWVGVSSMSIRTGWRGRWSDS
jgi:cytochrome c oxidase assembly protein subunit 15